MIGLVAAKVMRKELFDAAEWNAANFLNQGRQIPFVAQFIAKREFDELVSLDHIIKRNYDLSEGTIRVIAKQLFEGLRLIHEKGLVHRDIKGENIMLHSPRGSGRVYVKIGDFGLVKFQDLQKQTMLMSAKGTPLNMAPELVIGDRKADAKVDVWSMGVVLFQLVAHEYPIKATSNKTIDRPIIIKDDLFWDLLVNLLAFDRTKRFSAEQALQHPYFTSTQALNEISQESHQIATSAQLAKSNGDTNITIYDIDPSYSLNGNEIKTALNYDPEIDLQP
ncbi:MAG: putative CAMK protein kinase, partial [Streblomastix strix]